MPLPNTLGPGNEDKPYIRGTDVLRVPMGDNDASAETIREYLVALLEELWDAGEGFSGKRPFGNSSWQHELYQALVAVGFIEGKIDEDGYIEECDDEAGDLLIKKAIEALRYA